MNEAAVRSPCVSVCRLDERNVCVGCWRSLEEIAAWSRLSDTDKRVVLSRAASRAGVAGQSAGPA